MPYKVLGLYLIIQTDSIAFKSSNTFLSVGCFNYFLNPAKNIFSCLLRPLVKHEIMARQCLP